MVGMEADQEWWHSDRSQQRKELCLPGDEPPEQELVLVEGREEVEVEVTLMLLCHSTEPVVWQWPLPRNIQIWSGWLVKWPQIGHHSIVEEFALP